MPTKGMKKEWLYVCDAFGWRYIELKGEGVLITASGEHSVYLMEKMAINGSSAWHTLPLYMLKKNFWQHWLIGKIGKTRNWGRVQLQECLGNLEPGCCQEHFTRALVRHDYRDCGKVCIRSTRNNTTYFKLPQNELTIFYTTPRDGHDQLHLRLA